MSLTSDINALPTVVGDGNTGHHNNHQVIHAALKDHRGKVEDALLKSSLASNEANSAIDRVTALEALGGLSPESPVDGQTANLIEQEGTLTSVAVIGSIQTSSSSVSVKDFGALGDGIADDTDAINAAIDHAVQVGIGRVTIPDGTYMIWGHIPGFSGNYIREDVGVILQDNIHLDMSLDATLKCIPNSNRQYNIISIINRKNVLVTGGRILGDRHEHGGTTGEWGYGIAIQGGENIEISGTRAFDCWGDGINIQRSITLDFPKRVRISGVDCNGNRRQGMSVEAVIGLSVTDSVFRNTGGTGGTPPGAGVDVEPVNHTNPVEGMVFKGCSFVNNTGPGMLIMQDGVNGITVEDCFFEGNHDSEAQLKTFSRGKNFSFLRNRFKDSPGDSIRAQAGSNYLISDNDADSIIRTSRGLGDKISNVTIRGNQVSGRITMNETENGVISQNLVQSKVDTAATVRIASSKNIVMSENVVVGGDRNVWVFDGYLDEPTTSENISIVGNVLKDAAFNSVDLQNVHCADVSGNRMVGSGADASESQNVYITSGVSGLRVYDNVFEHGKSGENRTQYGIRWTSTVLDTVAYGNRLISDGDYPYTLYRGDTLETGYIGNEWGIMVGTTLRRPTQPNIATQYFDTNLGKMILWDGTEWVYLDGTPLVAPLDPEDI